ncbi:unnamed protein product [Nezara viridula]|uniref:Rhophilin-2 n=1 Tax=Nezara viridula TaxID=85310 RepID=A0A9P0H070_NEZVI|nr:unnamed protein product [Nezara viridula]
MAQAAVIRAHNRAQAKGSDPRVATCRGKLQSKRSKLNQEINKELRLRAGAENLFRATTNRKLRETVALELSFVNSNLQLLKEQLAELNSSVELYQGESSEPVMPVIPLGLKETKDIDFREPFKDFILEHYSEDGSKYDSAINDFMEMRQAMRTPHRDHTGISLLLEYYNQLYFVERRFFPPDRSLGIFFEWYDSLTGVPSSQRTVAFEKACVLLNVAALYTQIAARKPRDSAKGLDSGVDNWLRAAGALKYLAENFTNPPSMDLTASVLDMLTQLMLAQAHEFLFEKLQLQSKDKRDGDMNFDLALEANHLSKSYKHLTELTSPCEFLPLPWSCLCRLKCEYYASLAHGYSADGVAKKGKATTTLVDCMLKQNDSLLDSAREQHAAILREAHLLKSSARLEEAWRVLRLNRELRTKEAISRVLGARSNIINRCDETQSLADIIEPPLPQGELKTQLRPTPPDPGSVPTSDLFSGLGPLGVFSARNRWTPPRTVALEESSGGFGFSITTGSPAVVTGVHAGSLAERCGLKEGDLIVGIGDTDVKWSSHEEVVRLIRSSGRVLVLKLVTPLCIKSVQQKSSKKPDTDTRMKQQSPKDTKDSKKLSWSIFKKPKDPPPNTNIILR